MNSALHSPLSLQFTTLFFVPSPVQRRTSDLKGVTVKRRKQPELLGGSTNDELHCGCKVSLPGEVNKQGQKGLRLFLGCFSRDEEEI